MVVSNLLHFQKEYFCVNFYSNSNLSFSVVNVSQYILAEEDAKSAILVGNCIVLNMVFSPMAKCRYVEMILSLRFLLKLEMGNTYPEVFLLISNLQSLTRSVQERIVSSLIQSTYYQVELIALLRINSYNISYKNE